MQEQRLRFVPETYFFFRFWTRRFHNGVLISSTPALGFNQCRRKAVPCLEVGWPKEGCYEPSGYTSRSIGRRFPKGADRLDYISIGHVGAVMSSASSLEIGLVT